MKPAARRSTRLDSRTFLAGLGGIALLAFALRLIVCVQLCPHPSVHSPAAVTDMATYRRLAMEIARGTLPSHFYYQPFYYAVFLPVIYRVCGTGPWGPALAQTLLGTAAVWLTGITGARLFGRRAGWLAAALLAISRTAVFYTPFLLIATLQSFWMALLAYLALQVWRERRYSQVVLLGLTTSAAVLSRGNVILLVPGVVALLAWAWRKRPVQGAATIALYIALVYVPQLPFSLCNLQWYGRWTGPSSAQDAVLALGNTPESPPGGLEYPETYHDWVDLAGRPGADRVPVSRQILGWLGRDPLQVIELKTRALLLFWHRMEIPNNIALQREGAASALLRLPPPFLANFAIIGTLGGLGLLLCFRRRSPPRLFAYWAVGAYCVSTVLFYILARFRLPVVPLLCVFAGGGTMQFWRLWRRPYQSRDQRQARLTALGAILASGFLVLDGYTWYQRLLGPAAARLVRPEGTVVRTHRRTLVYDRGAFALGGITLLTVPPEGIVVTKHFRLPQDLPPMPPELRIPVHMRSGTTFKAVVQCGDTVLGTDAMSITEDSICQRLVFALQPPAPGIREMAVVVTIQPSAGEMAIVADASRWYGRTEWVREGKPLPAQLEAGFELHWPVPQPPP